MNELELFKTLIAIFDNHTNTVNTLWGIYYAISLALLGFVYKSRELWCNETILLVISIGFAIFAFSNSQAINRSQQVIEETSTQIMRFDFTNQKQVKYLNPVACKYNTVSSGTLRIASLVFSILVIIGIWAPYISKKFSKNGVNLEES